MIIISWHVFIVVYCMLILVHIIFSTYDVFVRFWLIIVCFDSFIFIVKSRLVYVLYRCLKYSLVLCPHLSYSSATIAFCSDCTHCCLIISWILLIVACISMYFGLCFCFFFYPSFCREGLDPFHDLKFTLNSPSKLQSKPSRVKFLELENFFS